VQNADDVYEDADDHGHSEDNLNISASAVDMPRKRLAADLPLLVQGGGGGLLVQGGGGGGPAMPSDEPVPSSAQFSMDLDADELDDDVIAELCELRGAVKQALQQALRHAFGLMGASGGLELVNLENDSIGSMRLLSLTLKATGTDVVSVLLVHCGKFVSSLPVRCTVPLSRGSVDVAFVIGKVQRLA
jgi:hypothetical protein